jgi:hypothetical protein
MNSRQKLDAMVAELAVSPSFAAECAQLEEEEREYTLTSTGGLLLYVAAPKPTGPFIICPVCVDRSGWIGNKHCVRCNPDAARPPRN